MYRLITTIAALKKRIAKSQGARVMEARVHARRMMQVVTEIWRVLNSYSMRRSVEKSFESSSFPSAGVRVL